MENLLLFASFGSEISLDCAAQALGAAKIYDLAMEMNTSKAALLCIVNCNTINSIYSKIRLKIIEYTLINVPKY